MPKKFKILRDMYNKGKIKPRSGSGRSECQSCPVAAVLSFLDAPSENKK